MPLQIQNWPLKYLSMGLALALSLFATLIIALPISNAAIQSMELQAQSLRSTVSKQASRQAAEAIFSQDLLSLNVILAGLVENPNIRYAAIYNLENKVMAEQGFADTVQGEPLSIQYQNQVIGLLEIRFDRSPLQQAIWQIYGLLVIFGLVLAVVASSLGWLLGKRLQTSFTLFMEDLTQLDNPEHPLSQHQLNGFFQCAELLTQMRSTQLTNKRLNCALSQLYANQFDQHGNICFRTQSKLLSVDHGTILVITLSDFTEQSKDSEPDELADLLKQYFYYFNKAARLYSGTLCQHAEGGVTILFGLNESDNKHRFHGVCAGLLIIGLIKQYNLQQTQQQKPTLSFTLGLHEGDILLNQTEQAQINVQGDNIAIASHICAMAKPNQLLASQTIISQGQLAPQLLMTANPLANSLDIETLYIDNLTPNYQALIERQVQHICIA